MFKGKNWFPSWNQRPKQVHSLEHLKYLYNVLCKNQYVTEQNRNLLVETLRSIAEILIWGDQNDSTVFDFFLEKNMLSFFLKIMKQRCGNYVCVQLLQTLNILFENIRNKTSLYYLLSNNYVNNIIEHKFDFSDEEVMAYYISFLKTMSFKLNSHTIHFFFNENTNDFPLYTEAIKFFNHSEKMVRIAVRTLTLNVFKVQEKAMLKFVGDHTAVPYFSNLVWFIGNHVLEIDSCLQKESKDQQMLIKLDDLVAEHLDHLHYLNDILLLRIDDLNEILTDHLLNRLLIPLYIYSLIASNNNDIIDNYNNVNLELDSNLKNSFYSSNDQLINERPKITKIVSLFLLSQVFLIISYDSLVQKLVDIILNGNESIFEKPKFTAPSETLEESLVNNLSSKVKNDRQNNDFDIQECVDNSNSNKLELENQNEVEMASIGGRTISINSEINHLCPLPNDNYEDFKADVETIRNFLTEEALKDRPFLNTLFLSLDCSEKKDDHLAIFSLCLIYAIAFNSGVKENQLKDIIFGSKNIPNFISNQLASTKLIDFLTSILRMSCQNNSFIRLITLEMSLLLLTKICIRNNENCLSDYHLAIIEQSKEESALILRKYYKEFNLYFLELFEEEYFEFKKFDINVEYLMMDANLLVSPSQLSTFTLNGLHFTKKLPCYESFFLVRNFSQKIQNEEETQLPISDLENLTTVGKVLNLKNSDLVSCTVIMKDQQKNKQFLVIDSRQLILIDPDNQHSGCGVVKFVTNLHQVNFFVDKKNSQALHLIISLSKLEDLIENNISLVELDNHEITDMRLIFEDHIRCMAAKKRLSKGKRNLLSKMEKIAKLIDMPIESSSGVSRRVPKSHSQNSFTSNCDNTKSTNRPLPGLAVPGAAVSNNFSTGLKNKNNKSSALNNNLKDATNSTSIKYFTRKSARKSFSSISSSLRGSRESSPKPPEIRNANEMIQMDDLSPKIDRKINQNLNGNIQNATTDEKNIFNCINSEESHTEDNLKS